MAYPRRSQDEIDRGLTALILAATSQEASELTGIPASTLREWRREKRDRYDELCEQLEPRRVKLIAAGAETLALAIEDKERRIIESLTDEEIASLPAKEKAATLRNLTTSKALQIDKLSSPLRERPSHVQHTTDPGELLAKMERLLGIQRVPNHAEITDAVAIEAEPSAVSLPSQSVVSNAHATPELDT